MLFFEASLVTAVLSIFCIPLLFRSSLLLSFEILLRCDSSRYSPQLQALIPIPMLPILLSSPISYQPAYPINPQTSIASQLPISSYPQAPDASDPPPSLTYLNHSHFPSFSSAVFSYTLSLLMPESLFLSLPSHPIAYRHSLLLSFPAFSNCPQRSMSQTLESFPDFRNFLSKPIFYIRTAPFRPRRLAPPSAAC